MSDADWAVRMNEEYEAATTDEERLEVLSRYMSPDMALKALRQIQADARKTDSGRDDD